MKNGKSKVSLSKKISVILFSAVILILALLTVFLPKKEKSEEENKVLATFPKFSVSSVFEGKFMKDLDTYFSDHFAFRTDWIAAETNVQKLLGKTVINDVFITSDRMIENVGEPNDAAVAGSIDAINRYKEIFGEDMQVALMLVPTAGEIYRDSYNQYAPVLDQTGFIQDVYGQLGGVDGVDVFSALHAARDSYIYYRTDHHWTSYGAYIGYAVLSKTLGYNPIGYEKFNVEHASDSFLGTVYSKVLTNAEMADTIDLYYYAAKNVVTSVEVFNGGETEVYDSIFFREHLEGKDKYSTYLGTNQPMITIHTNVDNGQKLLMFKDSYSHEMVQFLCQHYEQITLMDMRYINQDFSLLADPADYTQTLFLYNVGGFIDETSLKKLNLAKGEE